MVERARHREAAAGVSRGVEGHAARYGFRHAALMADSETPAARISSKSRGEHRPPSGTGAFTAIGDSLGSAAT